MDNISDIMKAKAEKAQALENQQNKDKKAKHLADMAAERRAARRAINQGSDRPPDVWPNRGAATRG